jgi:hypothetical protein
MPTDVQVTLQGISGLSHDRYVNILHFDGDQWNASLADELWAKYDNFLLYGAGNLATGTLHSIRCYEPGLNPEGPYFQKHYALSSARTTGGPSEVAICLSYSTADDPDRSTPRRRGRIYLGPLSTTQVGSVRPTGALMAQVVAFGQAIAQVGTASNVTWMMKSSVDNSYHKIESVWCDDSWDTQRRRGLKPTTRQVGDVQ